MAAGGWSSSWVLTSHKQEAERAHYAFETHPQAVTPPPTRPHSLTLPNTNLGPSTQS